MSDIGPKSAYELAMERLRRKDEEAGTVHQPLSEAARQAIAEVRTDCEARVAQLEVMHKSEMARTVDPAEYHQLEMEYRRERERLTRERDEKIEAIRRNGK